MTAALTGLNNKTNLDETLKMTGAQVSWMGKIETSLFGLLQADEHSVERH